MSRVNFKKDAQLLPNLKQYLKPYFKFGKNRTIEPLESWLFIAHYKLTVGLLLCLFVSLVGCWFSFAPVECVVKYYEQVDFKFEDLCLSYPYVYNNSKEKVFALHYKWVHWSLLLLIPLYCVPLHMKKHFEVEILNEYLYFINNCDMKDPKRNPCISIVTDSFIGHCAGSIYINKLIMLAATLFVDVVAIFFLDVALQNRFFRLFPLDYPFTRWPQYLNDTLSLAFPQFVECRIGPSMVFLNEMTEVFGCNLTMMKLYDKLFVIMWVWMMGLTLYSFFTLIHFIVLGFSKFHQKSLIKMEGCKREVQVCLKHLCVGDMIVIKCLSSVLNNEENKEVLKKLARKIESMKKSSSIL
ncbi:UNVERIFIED_CONTAM: hypothetical protein RMT77_013815 [Armadillidium vulgare]